MFIDTAHGSRERTWPPEPVSVSPSRHFLRETLTLLSLQAVGDDAAVVLSELATNAVVHARTDFTVSLSPSGRQALRLGVTDGSTQMPRQATNRDATGGRGLELLDVLSAEWGAMLNGVEGKTVWAVHSPGPSCESCGGNGGLVVITDSIRRSGIARTQPICALKYVPSFVQ